MLIALLQWFDADSKTGHRADDNRIDWLRVLPFIALHAACLLVFLVGFSWVALWIAISLYAIRMFAITGFYHRFFAHKAFKTSRAVQFAFAVIGAMSAQRGPLWWTAHHRHHHRHSDTENDLHSPCQHGFLWSHLGWFLTQSSFHTDRNSVNDLNCYPELRMLDRFDTLAPILLAAVLFGLGSYMSKAYPELGTSGPQLLVWGFFVSTVALFHVTVTINSFAHRYGSRRFATKDDSRNNVWLALLTFGEGWHNNHHHYPGSARQGFCWWEIDFTYYLLRLMSALGLVWDLKPIPASLKRTH